MDGRILTLSLLFVCALGGPSRVAAADLGHWSVLPLPRSCIAVNRPPAELDAFPANALVLTRRHSARETELQVWFWPGYLEGFTSGELNIAATAANRRAIAVRPVEHASDKAVSARLSAEDGAWKALLDGGTVSAWLAGRPETLTFDVSDLPAVLSALDECVSTP